MVMTSVGAKPTRFTVFYTGNSSVLVRVLDALARYGLEPSWVFSRIRQQGGFRLDVQLSKVCEGRAGTIAARIANMPDVMGVQWKAG